MLNKITTNILDVVTIIFLILFSTAFLFFFGLTGGGIVQEFIPALTQELGAVIMMLMFAVIAGTIIHFFQFFGRLGALIFTGILWILLVVGFVFGLMPPEYTPGVILLKAIIFIFPLIYLYLVYQGTWMAWFQWCAWAYGIVALVLVIATLPGGSALTFTAGVMPFIITLLFVLVAVYILYRLIMEMKKV